jgi:hypothetical protein
VPKYVFILSPPYSGSTVLWQLLQTSPHVSALPTEGQYVEAVKHLMITQERNPDHLPWTTIKDEWSKLWNFEKPLLLEKSTRNLPHAKDIEQVFSPCWFIAMMRDPYALCEGLARRRNRRNRLLRSLNGTPATTSDMRVQAMRIAAGLWQQYATQQIQNVQGLERVISLTYEELTENTPNAVAKIIAFLPELGHLNVAEKFRVHSVTGTDRRSLRNMNRTKWQCLRRQDIEAINSVLVTRRHCLDFFGYRMKQPDHFQDLRSAAMRSMSLILKVKNEGRETVIGRKHPTTGRSRWRWLPGMPG